MDTEKIDTEMIDTDMQDVAECPAETVSFWGSCVEFAGWIFIGIFGGL